MKDTDEVTAPLSRDVLQTEALVIETLLDTRGLLADYREQEISRRQSQEFAELAGEMDPEVRNGLFTAVKAVVQFGVPMAEAMTVFNEVVDERQGKSAA